MLSISFGTTTVLCIRLLLLVDFRALRVRTNLVGAITGYKHPILSHRVQWCVRTLWLVLPERKLILRVVLKGATVHVLPDDAAAHIRRGRQILLTPTVTHDKILLTTLVVVLGGSRAILLDQLSGWLQRR